MLINSPQNLATDAYSAQGKEEGGEEGVLMNSVACGVIKPWAISLELI